MSYVQTTWLAEQVAKPNRNGTDSTFVDNLRLPVHRWYRYSAGYSGQWVETVVSECKRLRNIVALDPFAGSGTTLIASEAVGVPCVGLEAHPFVARIAKAKLHYRTDVSAFETHAWRVSALAREMQGTAEGYPDLIRRIFSEDSLAVLDSMRSAHLKLDDGSPQAELTWLALVAILR